MKKKISPTVVGAFVAGGMILGLAALVSFGSGRLFRKPERFIVELRQTSISGLDVGSPVKFSGVRVGRVQDVSARMDAEAAEVIVRVGCTIDEDAAVAMFPPPAPSHGEIVQRLVANGMSAELNFSGITGLLYVNLVINPERRGQAVVFDPASGTPIVPAEQSVLEELSETLTTIAANLARIDFPGISADLRKVLADLDAVLVDLDLRGTLERINAAADSVGGLAANSDLRGALEKLNQSMDGLQKLLADVRNEVPVVSTELKKTLADSSAAMRELSDTARRAQELLAPRGGLGSEIAATLEALRDAAAGAEQLMDFLERNPTALVRGRADSSSESSK